MSQRCSDIQSVALDHLHLFPHTMLVLTSPKQRQLDETAVILCQCSSP